MFFLGTLRCLWLFCLEIVICEHGKVKVRLCVTSCLFVSFCFELFASSGGKLFRYV